MFNTLHRRLTWLYTVTTGCILTLVLAGVLLFMIREEENKQLERFQSVWTIVSSKLQFDSTISHSWISQMETENHIILYIEENQKPLLYRGSWQPPASRDFLIENGKTMAEAQGVFMDMAPVSSSSAETTLMILEGDSKDQYYARVLSLATEKGVKSLCMISLITPGLLLLNDTVWFLFFLELAGVLCLFFVSWHFVAWALKPAKESQRKQAEFIAAASHELRSPLAVLRSSIAAIHAVPEERNRLLAHMDQECQRMARLVSDMLLLASTDAKTWSIRLEKTEVDTLLINAYEMFLPLCRKKKVSLDLQLPETPLDPIEADAERLTQVLTVLLDNALCYSPSGSRITIRVRQAPFSSPGLLSRLRNRAMLHTVIDICDQGRGIPDWEKPHVFDRFYRGDSSRTDKQHFGLGLSIASELIRLHHGTISVSDHEGGGSIFSIRLFSQCPQLPKT